MCVSLCVCAALGGLECKECPVAVQGSCVYSHSDEQAVGRIARIYVQYTKGLVLVSG